MVNGDYVQELYQYPLKLKYTGSNPGVSILFVNFAPVFFQTLNETVQLDIYYLIICFKSYLCCFGKARNVIAIYPFLKLFVYWHADLRVLV
jgi:hypothetical protein